MLITSHSLLALTSQPTRGLSFGRVCLTHKHLDTTIAKTVVGHVLIKKKKKKKKAFLFFWVNIVWVPALVSVTYSIIEIHVSKHVKSIYKQILIMVFPVIKQQLLPVYTVTRPSSIQE